MVAREGAGIIRACPPPQGGASDTLLGASSYLLRLRALGNLFPPPLGLPPSGQGLSQIP